MRRLLAGAVVAMLACGGSDPTAPEDPAPTIALFYVGSAADRDSAQLSWDFASAWFTRQTGLRIKTDGVVRLASEQPTSLPDSVKALVYIDTSNANQCGGAHVNGQVGVLYLDAPGCWTPWGLWSINQRDAERFLFPTYREKSAIHEIMHLLGAVPFDAPNACGQSHVCDDDHDIMWNYALSGSQSEFDTDRADYWHLLVASPWTEAAP